MMKCFSLVPNIIAKVIYGMLIMLLLHTVIKYISQTSDVFSIVKIREQPKVELGTNQERYKAKDSMDEKIKNAINGIITDDDFKRYQHLRSNNVTDENTAAINKHISTFDQEKPAAAQCSSFKEAKHSLFLWEIAQQTWFEVRNTTVIKTDNMTFGTLHLDKKNVFGLQKGGRARQELASILQNNDTVLLRAWLELADHSKPLGRNAIFQDVIVSSDGWIANQNICLSVRNGGCYNSSPTSWTIPNIPIMHYNNVISIATYWGYGIWHFVMEAFVGLAHISKLDLQSHFIHVNAKNSWTLDWLSLIGITKSRIISGTISARRMVVPEIGRCGTPSLAHLQWLKTQIPVKIPIHPNDIVLIKRTKYRVMQDFHLVQELVETFARKHGFHFVLHDDASLPSLKSQLQRFANASIVIGPHGAGFLHLIATSKKACVIEFLPPTPQQVIIYARLSYLQGQTYFSIPLYDNKFVNVTKVNQTLELCLKTRNNDNHP